MPAFGQDSLSAISGVVGPGGTRSQYEHLPNLEITPKRIVTRLNGYSEGPEDLKAVAGESIVPLSTSPPEGGRRSYESEHYRSDQQSNRNSIYHRRASGQLPNEGGGAVLVQVPMQQQLLMAMTKQMELEPLEHRLVLHQQR